MATPCILPEAKGPTASYGGKSLIPFRFRTTYGLTLTERLGRVLWGFCSIAGRRSLIWHLVSLEGPLPRPSGRNGRRGAPPRLCRFLASQD
jgi:hypothetical protein